MVSSAYLSHRQQLPHCKGTIFMSDFPQKLQPHENRNGALLIFEYLEPNTVQMGAKFNVGLNE